VRDARGQLGRAIRAARRRRLLGNGTVAATSALVAPAAVVKQKPSRRPMAARARAALAIIALLVLLIAWPAPQTDEDPGGGLPAAPALVQRQILRGKSLVLPPTLAPLALITPLPQPIATPTERPERPENAGGGAPAPGGVPGGTGAGTGGSGTGSGGGSGPGTGLGTPKPIPTQPPPPAAIPPGYGRLMIVTVDALSGAVVPEVCLIVGSVDCSPTKPHTDGAGRWWVDVPLSQPTTNFDVRFIHPGYTTDFRRFVLLKGQTVTYVVRLQPYQQREAG